MRRAPMDTHLPTPRRAVPTHTHLPTSLARYPHLPTHPSGGWVSSPGRGCEAQGAGDRRPVFSGGESPPLLLTALQLRGVLAIATPNAVGANPVSSHARMALSFSVSDPSRCEPATKSKYVVTLRKGRARERQARSARAGRDILHEAGTHRSSSPCTRPGAPSYAARGASPTG